MPRLKDGTYVYRGDVYLDHRLARPDAFRAVEAAGRVRVQREVGDLHELVVTVAPEPRS